MSKRRKYNDFHRINIYNIEEKQCKDCGSWFEMNETNFRLQPSQKDGFSDRCIACQYKYNKKYYSKTREHQIQKAMMRYYSNPEINRKNVEHNKKKYHEDPIRQMNVKKAALKSRKKGNEKRWRMKNKEKVNLLSKKRKVKKHQISSKEWLSCKNYFNNSCAYCGLPLEKHYMLRNDKLIKCDLHKEHVAHDGSVYLGNCIPSCLTCNSAKHQDALDEWYNENNPVYRKERYDKIIKWITEDYKKYIEPKNLKYYE